MHNNYFLLRRLAASLNSLLPGAKVLSCFSQEKNELVLELALGDQSHFTLHAVMRPDLCTVRFPRHFTRARKNTVDLFPEIIHQVIGRVFCAENERCLLLEFASGWSFMFKMFGRKSNTVLFQGNRVVSLFKQREILDLELDLSTIGQTNRVDEHRFKEHSGDFRKLMPTLGPRVKNYLYHRGYEDASLTDKWLLFKEVLDTLEHGDFYLHWEGRLPVVTLFDPGDSFYTTSHPVEILNEFYRLYISRSQLEKERRQMIRLLEQKLKRGETYLKRVRRRLDELNSQVPYQEIADMIMAYMHKIPKGARSIELARFENAELVNIKLKSSLSPQNNAERYYRKAKNQKKEVAVLQGHLKMKTEQRQEAEGHLAVISDINDLKTLRKYARDHGLIMEHDAGKENQQLFKKFIFRDYTILVGKSAANNDELTQKYAHKEDLWLHAKDVKGSHVIIKNKPGKGFPAAVLERAAQLAAYYSKRKNDSLCPVIYTPKKFVRKTKGASPGQVVVDKEQVILVTPAP